MARIRQKFLCLCRCGGEVFNPISMRAGLAIDDATVENGCAHAIELLRTSVLAPPVLMSGNADQPPAMFLNQVCE